MWGCGISENFRDEGELFEILVVAAFDTTLTWLAVFLIKNCLFIIFPFLLTRLLFTIIVLLQLNTHLLINLLH